MYGTCAQQERQPLNQDKFVLIGMMGSGKTTLGRMLAERMRMPFMDADAVFESEAGMTVAEYFRRHGDAAFRGRELEVMKRLLGTPGPALVASGGGAFCQDETRRHLRKNAVTIFLRVERHELLRRLGGTDVATRPMLENENWRERVTELVLARYPVYEQADAILDIGDETPEETVGRLHDLLRKMEKRGEKAC